jgi:hypothetical protein
MSRKPRALVGRIRSGIKTGHGPAGPSAKAIARNTRNGAQLAAVLKPTRKDGPPNKLRPPRKTLRERLHI